MINNDMIRILEYYQNKYNVSQRALCEGVCAMSVVSKIKMDDRVVDFLVLETLLARLGKDVDEFEFSLSDEDYELRNIRAAIKSDMWSKDMIAARKNLQLYRCKMPKESKVHEQFCLYYEMKQAECCGEMKKTCELAKKALLLTKNEEDAPQKKHNLYTYMEIDLLLTLVHYRYGRWEEKYRVEGCLWDVMEYVNIYYAAEHLEEFKGRVWIELLRLSQESGAVSKALECVEGAINCFEKSARVGQLAQVRFMKAQLLAKAKVDVSAKWREQSMEECKMAYCIYLALGKGKQIEEIEQFCLEELQWHITI